MHDKIKRGPEFLAKAIREGSLLANSAPDEPFQVDFWENPNCTPEWKRDDYRYMAWAAARALLMAIGVPEAEALVEIDKLTESDTTPIPTRF